MHGILLAVLLAATADPGPRLAATHAELQRMFGDYEEPEMPPAARPLLTRYKHQLRDLAAASIAAEGMPVDAQRRMKARLDELGVGTDVVFWSPTADPNLMAVTTTVGIPCGEDTSLYLFRRGASGWRLILAREANGYAKVDGALATFRFAVSPPDARGRFFVVTANVNPWCVSNWQALRFDVLRPGEDPDRPHVLLRAERGIYRPYDYELSVTQDGFRIDWTAENHLDYGRLFRGYVERYAVHDESVRRIPPLAGSELDFVAVWSTMPWPKAARYGGTREVHQLIAGRRLSEFGQQEENADGSWTVPLDVTKRDAGREMVTFTVKQEGDDYRITNIEREPLPEEAWSIEETREELWKALGTPAARRLLARYKRQLREFAAVTVAREGNAEKAQRRAAELFEEMQVKDDAMTFSGTDVIEVTITIGLPGGKETSRYRFRRLKI